MRIVVLGAGESGVGAAILAKTKGFDVFVSDMGSIKDYYKQMLNDYDIPWEEGQHTDSLILNADEVIKSPGIPCEAPLPLKLKEQGIPVISEIEFAGRYTHAKMICITGSNGKTTTTSLIYHIFKRAGYNVGLAGNIGRSLALQVATKNYDYYVIELSSFQLDNMYDFRAHIAVLMNITQTISTATITICRNTLTPSFAFCKTRRMTMHSFSGTTTPSSDANWANMVSMGDSILLPNWKLPDCRLSPRTANSTLPNRMPSTWNKRLLP